MKNGLHQLMAYENPEALDSAAMEHVRSKFPNANLPGMHEIHRQRRGIRGLPGKIKEQYNKLSAKYRW